MWNSSSYFSLQTTGIEDWHFSGNNATQNTVVIRMQFCAHLVIISSWCLEDMISTNLTGSDQSQYENKIDWQIYFFYYQAPANMETFSS